jgi:hypothetical protein
LLFIHFTYSKFFLQILHGETLIVLHKQRRQYKLKRAIKILTMIMQHCSSFLSRGNHRYRREIFEIDGAIPPPCRLYQQYSYRDQFSPNDDCHCKIYHQIKFQEKILKQTGKYTKYIVQIKESVLLPMAGIAPEWRIYIMCVQCVTTVNIWLLLYTELSEC